MEIETLGTIQEESKLQNICKWLLTVLAFDQHTVQHVGSQQKISEPQTILVFKHLFFWINRLEDVKLFPEYLFQLGMDVPKSKIAEISLIAV